MMRKVSIALFTVLFLACKEKPQPVSAPPSPAARPTQAQGWTRADLASSLNVDPTRPSSQPALAISDGQPAVAWREGHRIYVKRWDGTAWRALNSPLNHDPNRPAQKPVLIAQADGTLAAAWLEMDPNDHSDVRVTIWNGSAWTSVGDTANPAGTTVDELKLLSTPGGLVVSSGQRYQGGPRQLFVRRWSGTAWQRLGPGPLNTAAGSEVKDDPRLALLASADLVVAWLESAPLTGVRGFVRRWNESAGSWEELPVPGGIDGDSRIAMTSNRSGELVLGRSWNSGLRPYTRLRNAKDTWTDIGLPDAKMENGGYIPVHLVVPGAGPNSVATLSSWQDALHLAHWDGARWEVIAPSVAPEAHKASEAALTVGPDGTIYVCWIDTRNEPAQLLVTSYKRP